MVTAIQGRPDDCHPRECGTLVNFLWAPARRRAGSACWVEPVRRVAVVNGDPGRLVTPIGGKSRPRLFASLLLWFFALSSLSPALQASSGTEGASFLEIPLGAGPAALGAAYTALANNAYAPTWNPGGLGFLDSTQISGEHLAYLQSISYEYASFVLPLGARGSGLGSPGAQSSEALSPERGALGGSIQYLGSGDISGTDRYGNPAGAYSNYYAAYNLSYGQMLWDDRFSLGATGKLIQAKLQDVSARAYAADLGGMYQVNRRLTLGATLDNLGTKLTFLTDGDPLPLAFHLGGAYQASSQWSLALEGVYPQTGLASAHLGAEWQPLSMLAFRMGYRTDALEGLSALAGFSAGLGFKVWGQELAYAWLPYGDLGQTHYVSAVLRFGGVPEAKRNLIAYGHSRRPANQATPGKPQPENPLDSDYQQLMELLTTQEQAVASGRNP